MVVHARGISSIVTVTITAIIGIIKNSKNLKQFSFIIHFNPKKEIPQS